MNALEEEERQVRDDDKAMWENIVHCALGCKPKKGVVCRLHEEQRALLRLRYDRLHAAQRTWEGRVEIERAVDKCWELNGERR